MLCRKATLGKEHKASNPSFCMIRTSGVWKNILYMKHIERKLGLMCSIQHSLKQFLIYIPLIPIILCSHWNDIELLLTAYEHRTTVGRLKNFILRKTWNLKTRAGHFGFAVLQCCTKSYFQATDGSRTTSKIRFKENAKRAFFYIKII